MKALSRSNSLIKMMEIQSPEEDCATVCPEYEQNLGSHGTHIIQKKLMQSNIHQRMQCDADTLRKKKKEKKSRQEHYQNSMFDSALNQGNCDQTTSNEHDLDSKLGKSEPCKSTEFCNTQIKRNKQKDELKCNISGNLHTSEHNNSISSRMFKLPNDLDFVQTETLDIGEIKAKDSSKKKKKSYSVDREDFQKAAVEHLMCEDSTSREKKKSKKKRKSSLVDEEYCQEEALPYHEHVHSAMGKGKEIKDRVPLGDEGKEGDVPPDIECYDLTIKKKKKKKWKILPVNVEHFQEEAAQHPECYDASNEKEKRKRKKRQMSPVYKGCQTEGAQDHSCDDQITSKTNESKKNDMEEKPDTYLKLESSHVKTDLEKNRGQVEHMLDQCEPSFSYIDNRLSGREPNSASTPKRKKHEKLKDLSDKKNVDNDEHELDIERLLSETVEHFHSGDSDNKSGKRKLYCGEEIVNIDGSPLNVSCVVKREKKRKKIKEIDLTFDQSEHNPTHTDGQMTGEARPIIVKRKKRSSDIENRVNEKTQNNDYMKKEQGDIEQQTLYFHDESDKKILKRKESKSGEEEEIIPYSQNVFNRNSILQTPHRNEKKSPTKIHYQEQKCGSVYELEKNASSPGVSTIFSGYNAELSFKTPTTSSRRSGSERSPPMVVVDRPSPHKRQKDLGGEFCQEELSLNPLFEPIVTISSEERPIFPAEDVWTPKSLRDHSNAHGNEPKSDDTSQTSDLRDGHFLDQDSLRSHTPSDGEKKFECPSCNKKFQLGHHLRRHSLTHTPRSERSYTCKICDKQYVTKKSFTLHTDTHTTRKYKCDVCGEKFFHPSHVRSHAVLHQKEPMFKCDLCNQEFPSRKELNGHLSRHTEKKHECLVCGKFFSFRSNLNQHMVTHSEKKTKVYECEFCPKEYRSRQNLHDHLRTGIHGEKNYVCPQCDCKFYLSRQLQYHSLVHSEQRPYGCPICEKTFKRRTDRKNHGLYHITEKSLSVGREKRNLISDAEKVGLPKMHLNDERRLLEKVDLDGGIVSGDGKEKMKSGRSDREPDEGAKGNIRKSCNEEEEDEYNIDDETEEEGKQEYLKCTCCRRIYREGDKLRCHQCILRNKNPENNVVNV